jgi:transglutaminase/protease-like cytokinesis protein 3
LIKKPKSRVKKHLKVVTHIDSVFSSGIIEQSEFSDNSIDNLPKRAVKAHMKKSLAVKKSKSTKQASLPVIESARLKSQKSMSSSLEKFQDTPASATKSRVTDFSDKDFTSSPFASDRNYGNNSDSKVASFGFNLFDLDDRDFD